MLPVSVRPIPPGSTFSRAISVVTEHDEVVAIPELALVVLIGDDSSGRREFAATQFASGELLSARRCRTLIGDDAATEVVTEKSALELVRFLALKRLEARRLTAIDDDNLRPTARQPLVHVAKRSEVKPVAIVFPGPSSPSAETLRGEGFRLVHILAPSIAQNLRVVRERLQSNRRDDGGPFDIIGDVHGCIDELVLLLGRLDYERVVAPDGGVSYRHPAGRRALFLGDLVDRGPASPQVLELVMTMVAAGDALCVPGNHDVKLVRWLRGDKVKISHGLAESLAQLEGVDDERRAAIVDFVVGLPGHLVLDEGRLVVAHAGMKQSYQGRSSGRVLAFALYGDTTGERDDYGLPVRLDWAAKYGGSATVVYGHTPVPRAEWHNGTICVDTGCVFGGHLTALRYPEREIVSVPAARIYYHPVKPIMPLRAPSADLNADG